MPVLTVHGCPPEPLGNYLKALGVFRVVSDQADPSARAWWRGGTLRLASRFAKEGDLLAWFRDSYAPSPQPSPWSVNSGWWPPGKAVAGEEEKGGDKRGGPFRALCKLIGSKLPRYSRFQNTAEELRALLGEQQTAEHADQLGFQAQAILKAIEVKDTKKKQRARGDLLRRLRNTSTERVALRWLDAAAVLGIEEDRGPAYFQILGDGGLEGVNSFAGNYYKRLAEHLPLTDSDEFWQSEKGKLSACRLEGAMFGRLGHEQQEKDAAGGFYFPGAMEAPNIGQKFVADPKKRVNPWDFILAMEGVLLWSVAAVRGLESHARPSFPFFCAGAFGGNPGLGATEMDGGPNAKTRGELWLPLWSSPAACGEVERLLAEGRVSVGQRTATHATEFALGLASLGVERGITAFARTGLLQRSGSGDQLTTLAVPLGTLEPHRLPSAALADQLGQYQSRIARLLVVHNQQPRRLVVARARLEAALMDFAAQKHERAGSLLPVLLTASRLERELAVTCGVVKLPAGESKVVEKTAPLLQPLRHGWRETVTARDDSGVLFDHEYPREFRIARAIASMVPWGQSSRQSYKHSVGPTRANLVPVSQRDRGVEWDKQSRSAVWSDGAPLLPNLAVVLHRRLVDAQRGAGDGLPLYSFYGASFTDLLALWRGELNEMRLGELIHALALVDFGETTSDAIASWQVRYDPTPSLAQAGVWFDGDTPRLSLRVERGLLSETELAAAFALPRAYALLNLCFAGGRLPAPPVENRLEARTGNEPYTSSPLLILNLLRAGRGNEALLAAAQTLRAKRYPPIVRDDILLKREWTISEDESRRVAGLLLIPARHTGVLAALCIKPRKQRS